MSILIGVGVVTTVTVIYLGKKGWQALHKAVGITPGVLIYQNPNAPLSLPDLTWQKLALNTQHLHGLSDGQLHQLQRIDHKVMTCQNYQHDLQAQNITLAVTEPQFVLHKLLHTRLPQMLASHYHLRQASINASMNHADNIKCTEASQLIQEALDNIEKRVDTLLEQLERQHLQDLRVMKRYMDSHNS